MCPAVNQQKDIVFDGTMTWSPFVEQTIAMVRDHENSYRRGPGYVVDEHDNVVERWADTRLTQPIYACPLQMLACLHIVRHGHAILKRKGSVCVQVLGDRHLCAVKARDAALQD